MSIIQKEREFIGVLPSVKSMDLLLEMRLNYAIREQIFHVEN